MLDLLHEKKEEQIALRWVQTGGGTQMRAGIDQVAVNEYAEALNAGAVFPPIIVFYDGDKYWLGDGFHRVAAYQKFWGESAVSKSIAADVRSGTRRDAVLYAAGANADHGLRRTNADKRRAVETLLHDGEWVEWSNREIARRCRVSEGFVRILREELTAYGTQLNGDGERKYIDKHGNEQTMKTSNIGRNAKPTITPNVHRATTDAIADAWDETPIVACPQCGAEQEDFDGFGVVHCEACGYCIHPSCTNGICGICGTDTNKPAPDGRGRAERLHDLRGLIARLKFTLEDLELAKALLGVDHIVIVERAAAHVRLTVGKLEELKARE